MTKIRDRPKCAAELTAQAQPPIAISSNRKRTGVRLRMFESTMLELIAYAGREIRMVY